MLYKEKGMNVTVKEITALAGYHRGIFYEYFDNTLQLLEEIETSLTSYIQEKAADKAISSEFGDEMIHQIKLLYEEKGEYMCVLLSEKGDLKFACQFKDFLKRGIKDKLGLANNTGLRIEIILEYMLSAVLNSFSLWYQNRDLMSDDEFIKLVRSLILNGIPASMSL